MGCLNKDSKYIVIAYIMFVIYHFFLMGLGNTFMSLFLFITFPPFQLSLCKEKNARSQMTRDS